MLRTVVLLSLAALAACGSAGGTPTGGLRGAVVRGPTAPVCRAGESCVTPARRTLLVFRRDGAEARTRTDGNGRYRITLAPGVWHVSLTRRGLGTAVSPATVRVVGGRVRTVGLSIDTGIR